jgi:hypothetical protein
VVERGSMARRGFGNGAGLAERSAAQPIGRFEEATHAAGVGVSKSVDDPRHETGASAARDLAGFAKASSRAQALYQRVSCPQEPRWSGGI